MNNNKELPGVVLADDFKDSGTLTLPNGSVAVIIVANETEGTYRAGAILRDLPGSTNDDIMKFISALGLGLLVAATDDVESTMQLAETADMSNIAAVRSDDAEFGAPSVVQTDPKDLESCDVTKLARA